MEIPKNIQITRSEWIGRQFRQAAKKVKRTTLQNHLPLLRPTIPENKTGEQEK